MGDTGDDVMTGCGDVFHKISLAPALCMCVARCQVKGLGLGLTQGVNRVRVITPRHHHPH